MELEENNDNNTYHNFDLENFEFLYNRFNYYYFYDVIHNDELEEIKIQNK